MRPLARLRPPAAAPRRCALSARVHSGGGSVSAIGVRSKMCTGRVGGGGKRGRLELELVKQEACKGSGGRRQARHSQIV